MDYKSRKKLSPKFKYRFFLGNQAFNRSAKLFIRRTTSNFIVTLTDLRCKVIICCTSGSAIKVQCNKKRRISPYAMEDIVQSLSKTLNRLNIKNLTIVLKIRTGMVVRFLFNEILSRGYKISCVMERLVCPHNGVRSRILPRK